jgi:glutamate-ammonia-ligase adenylyltransferase
MLAESSNLPGSEGGAAAVLDVRREELARVAVADLRGLLDVPTVGHALSDVTDATIEAMLAVAVRDIVQKTGEPLPVNLAVIALGRVGSKGTGYGSDADVVFVHEPLAGESRASRASAAALAISTAQHLIHLFTLDASRGHLLLDARLRPEGRMGALSRSLAAYKAHYVSRPWIWDTQQLLRARPVAGDPELARQFVELVDGVRYPSNVSAEDLKELLRLQRRMEVEGVHPGVDPALHLKRGLGGLTGIETVVQVLQLRHAHAIPGLRTTSALTALSVAVDAGLLSPEQGSVLRNAWLTASKTRNAIMLAGRVGSDVIPTEPGALAEVAQLLGYPADDSNKFLGDYRRLSAEARVVIEAVLARELPADPIGP